MKFALVFALLFTLGTAVLAGPTPIIVDAPKPIIIVDSPTPIIVD